MGLISTKDFQEMQEEDMPPPTPMKVKYIEEEDFDPRSPTLGITRTPIQIIKVPQQLEDPRSPTAGIERTPICPLGKKRPQVEVNVKENLSKNHLPMLNDPRSPTQGIDRTPICLKTQTQISKFEAEKVRGDCDVREDDDDVLNDPRSPTEGIDRTPICLLREMNLDPESSPSFEPAQKENDEMFPEPIKMTSLEDHMEEIAGHLQGDLILNLPSLHDDIKEEAEKEVVKKDVPTKKSKKSKPILMHTNVEATDSEDISSTNKLKNKNINTRSPLKVLGDRSPLSSRNVDYNSPRAIVQRKQSGKVALKKTALQMKPFTMKNSPKYKVMEEDKENL